MAVSVNGISVGVTLTGFVLPQITDVQADIEATLKSKFGAGINLKPSSFFGQISGIFSEREYNVWAAMQDVYTSQDPDQATGASLDNLGALRGIPRLQATYSTISDVRLFGTAGTPIPAGTTQFSVVGAPTSLFAANTTATLAAGQSCVQTLTFSGVPASGTFVLALGGSEVTINWNDSAATIQTKARTLLFASGCVVSGSIAGGLLTITFAGAGTGGLMIQPVFVVASATNTLLDGSSATVTVTPAITTPGIDQAAISVSAVDTGPVVANAGSLTVIATPISGLSGVLSTQDAVVGRDIEADNAYRARQELELQIAGAGTVEAIRSRLLQVTGVTSVVVFENVTEVTDNNGLAPNSFEAFVSGGTDADIAAAIWAAKPAGIQSDGTVDNLITDSQGLQHHVFFSRPTEVDIYMIAQVTPGADYPADGDSTVKTLLVDYVNALGQGVSIIVVPKLISALASVPGIEDVVILIGTAPAPVTSANVAIGIQQIAIADTSRTSVTHV